MNPLPPAGNLPKVLVFTEGVLSHSHGTGVVFERVFAGYPRDRLANWFIGSAENPLLPGTLDLNRQRWPAHAIWPPTVALARIWNRLVATGAGIAWSVPVDRSALRAAARAQAGAFELAYAHVHSKAGVDSFYAVLGGLPADLPAVLHVLDFYPSAHLGYGRALRRLAPRLRAVWAASPAIARVLAATLGRPVATVYPFHCDFPARWKLTHAPVDAGFRAVTLGRFWNPRLLDDLKAAWRGCQSTFPGLGPVRWFCHPEGVAQVRTAGLQPEPEVEPMPYLPADRIHDELVAADLAIIPFSRDAVPRTDYERYSIPSRLTEIAAAGLPVCGLTGSGTPLHEYLHDQGIGLCAPAGDTRAATELLLRMLNDRELRARLGRQARQIAERDFPVERHRQWLQDEFRSLARRSP